MSFMLVATSTSFGSEVHTYALCGGKYFLVSALNHSDSLGDPEFYYYEKRRKKILSPLSQHHATGGAVRRIVLDIR